MNKDTDSNARPRVILSIRVVMMVPILDETVDTCVNCSGFHPIFSLQSDEMSDIFFGMTFR